MVAKGYLSEETTGSEGGHNGRYTVPVKSSGSPVQLGTLYTIELEAVEV